jgi:hypothetical protein
MFLLDGLTSLLVLSNENLFVVDVDKGRARTKRLDFLVSLICDPFTSPLTFYSSFFLSFQISVL